MKKVTRIIDTIAVTWAYIVCAAVIVALGLTVAEIVARSVLHRTTYIANEYSGYCMAIICFFGYSYCLKEDAHIRMDILEKRIKGKTLHLYRCLLYAIGFAVIAYVAYHLTLQWLDVFTLKTRSVQITRTPLWIPQLALPIGAWGLCLQFVSEFLKSVLRIRGAELPDDKQPQGPLGELPNL